MLKHQFLNLDQEELLLKQRVIYENIMYDVDEWINKTRLNIESEVKADDSISQVGLST